LAANGEAMSTKTKIQIAMGIIAFCIWSVMVYFDPSLRSDYVKFIVSLVIGISALALRDMKPPMD
jgi:hypothetical protein